MGYDNMDHGGWVQNNIDAVRRMKAKLTKRDQIAQANRKGWHGAPEKLNAFHHRAFGILGVVGNGIYNAPIVWDSVHWMPESLVLDWGQSLATRDFRGLTDLVLLAHDAAIRIDLGPNMRNMRIIMHQRIRPPAGGSVCMGHPTLEEAVASHRARFPVGHPLHLESALQVVAE